MLFIAFCVYSQTSTKTFSFQGYAIDPDGKAIAASSITAKFTVYDTGGSGATYTEEQTISTDAFGVFTSQIGSKTPADFQKLNFTADNASFWLKVEVKKTVAGTYTTINEAVMSAVPYARYADNGVPVGSIIPFAGPKTKIPDGWLACDGTSYDGSNALYSQLYAVIGSGWGSTGGTQFNVPDLRGLFLRGVDETANVDNDKATRTANNTGGNIGNLVGSEQIDIFGSHIHTNSCSTTGAHTHVAFTHGIEGDDDGSGGSANEYTYVDNNTTETTSSNGDHTHTVTINAAGGTETRPENAYVYYIIKY